MTRKKRKPASFDAMVKFFIRNYDIPTRKDVDMLMAKLDRLESLIKAGGYTVAGSSGERKASVRRNGAAFGTAAEAVYQVIRNAGDGVGFAEIRTKTGFGEKKVRNTIYRLHNTGRIARKSRGLYVATEE